MFHYTYSWKIKNLMWSKIRVKKSEVYSYYKIKNGCICMYVNDREKVLDCPCVMNQLYSICERSTLWQPYTRLQLIFACSMDNFEIACYCLIKVLYTIFLFQSYLYLERCHFCSTSRTQQNTRLEIRPHHLCQPCAVGLASVSFRPNFLFKSFSIFLPYKHPIENMRFVKWL